MLLDLVLRLMHVLSAIVLVGGMFYQRLALIPALRSVADDTRRSVLDACRGPWAKAVMAASGFLLVSGLINAVRNILGYEIGGGYHGLVAVKLFVALAIFWISATLAGRSSTAERFREKAEMWLSINLVLAVLIVCIASYMKVQPRTPKTDASATSVPADLSKQPLEARSQVRG